MTDSRIKKAADILVNYSTEVKKSEKVQVIGDVSAQPLILEVYKLVLKNDAFPTIKLNFPSAGYHYYKLAKEHQLKHFPQITLEETKQTDVFIYIGGDDNTRELTNIDPKKISLRQKILYPISKERLKKKWVIFDYPTNSLAQEADMSLDEFEDFVFKATNIDWRNFTKRMEKIKKLMESGTEVKITGENTDISFSTKGRKYVLGNGTRNMPDGEIFTAPIETSTNGYIKFSYPAIYAAREVDGVFLEFKNGNIIKAKASKNESFLKTMINTDKGAKKLGEFGIGLNPNIKKFIKNILFDEKINGTIHLAIGSAYKDCNGVNESAVHWDFIKDLRKNGKVFLDDKLIAKNGKFLL